ncbi:type I-E CRISPR-associated endoribonuclease Cas2e [Elioraea sp.]|uniref:type I-E CRISPR-associated endoribonuclease Cas2e n=1 Tax=Elioraea sp. TaxID=2185103 RepID=UPI00307DCA0D
MLDIADLVRTTVTIPVAFRAAKEHLRGSPLSLDALVRRGAAAAFRTERVIPTLIKRIKALFQMALAVTMMVIVTRDVAPRLRGFLASVMLEIAPSVTTSPRLSAGVRDRVSEVMEAWFDALGSGSIVMTWRDLQALGGHGIRVMGLPAQRLAEIDGTLVV